MKSVHCRKNVPLFSINRSNVYLNNSFKKKYYPNRYLPIYINIEKNKNKLIMRISTIPLDDFYSLTGFNNICFSSTSVYLYEKYKASTTTRYELIPIDVKSNHALVFEMKLSDIDDVKSLEL